MTTITFSALRDFLLSFFGLLSVGWDFLFFKSIFLNCVFRNYNMVPDLIFIF